MADVAKPKSPPAAPPQVAGEIAPPRQRRYRALLFQAYLIVALSISAVLALLASGAPYFAIDLAITRGLQALRLPGMTPLMELVSWPGYDPQITILVFLIVALVFWLGLRWEAVMLFIVAIVDLGLNSLVKVSIARPRPTTDLVEVFRTLSSYSYPSGHVMFYAGFFGFLFFLVFTLLKPSWKRRLLLLILGFLILLVGVSRVYLGEHWASDVLGAYLLGSLVLIAGILLYRWGKPRFFVTQPVAPEPVEPAGAEVGPGEDHASR